MKVCSPPEFFQKNMSHEQLLLTWSTFRDSSMSAKLKYFLKNSWSCDVRQNFFTKTCLTNNYFSCDLHFIILAWIQSWNIFGKLMKVSSAWIFSQKHVSRTITFSCDLHYMILAWVQCWNIFEKLMKVCSPPEFFHKNMSHEQSLFTWSTFHDSSMGTKLKYFWRTHETEKSARIYSQKHVSRAITFHVIYISWF